jgi:ubiquinone biosynthesis protein
MELLDGIKLSELGCRQSAAGYPPEPTADGREPKADLGEVARRGAMVFLEMIFRDGFYHADPHPGNLMVLKDGVIGVLDCGMVGRIDGAMRDDLEEVLMALAQRDPQLITAVIMRVGLVPTELDEPALSGDIAELLGDYSNQPLDQLDLGHALNDITEVIRRHHIVLPTGIALLIKVLVMLDGTARLLHPQFNLTELIQPFYAKLRWKRLAPATQWQKLRRLYHEWEYLTRMLPRGLVGLVHQLQSGRFDVHLEHKRLEPSVNRLVLGLLTSSLFLGSALMWTHHVPPVLFEVSLVGAAGVLLSIVMGIRLLWAIRKSGHLDRR